MKTKTLENWQIHFFSYILGIEQSFLTSATPISDLPVRVCADIYKRGYLARLTESMGDTFEATWWVMGDEDFLKLVGEFIKNIPSRSFDLSDYGKEFPSILKSSEVMNEIPFISELARFEWLFKDLFNSADVPASENFLQLLSEDPNVKLRILPSIYLWSSAFSIYEIWKTRSGNISRLNEFDFTQKENILCRKLNGKVHMTYLDESEFLLLRQFENPSSVSDAIESFQKITGETSPEAIQSLFARIGSLGVLGLSAV